MLEIRLIGTPEEVKDEVARIERDYWVMSHREKASRQDGKVIHYFKVTEHPHGKHRGMWLDVDGEPVHMLADPNMSQKTADALAAVVRAARKMVDDGT